jgi:hypothetical protein
MTNDTQTGEQTVTAPTTESAPDLGSLSFTEYQRVRRGGEMPASPAKESAPAAEKSQPVQKKESPESDTEELEAKESDSEDESATDQDESKDDGKEKPKKKGGFQRRIDKLNAARSAAQQEAEYWKRRALEGSEAPKTEKKSDTQGSKTASQEGKPNPDQFETHSEYVEALTDWKTEQKLQEREQRAEKSKLEQDQKQKLEGHSKRVQSFAEKTEDFFDVIEAVDDVPVSPTLSEVILSSENGPELMYELAKNRKEYERINSLGPIAAAREIGKLEHQIAARASSATEEKKTETKKITQAPKPIEPVGRSPGKVSRSLDDPDLSFTEYEKLRRDQMRRKRGA